MDQKKLIVFFKITFFIWLFFIFIISVYPGNLIGLLLKGDPTTYPGGDKISHFISYLALSILGVLVLDFKKKRYSYYYFSDLICNNYGGGPFVYS